MREFDHLRIDDRGLDHRSIIEIMEDISLPPDSCMIETDGGIFDCSLGTELSELSTKLRMLSYSKDDSNN